MDELECCAERAERLMNRALEQRCWRVVQDQRDKMLAMEAERRRRLSLLEMYAASSWSAD
jgi:hypothetical protein